MANPVVLFPETMSKQVELMLFPTNRAVLTQSAV